MKTRKEMEKHMGVRYCILEGGAIGGETVP